MRACGEQARLKWDARKVTRGKVTVVSGVRT